MAAMTTLEETIRDTVQFLLPRQCAGCGVDGDALCDECVGALSEQSHLVQLAISRHLFGRPVIAVCDYDPRAKAVVTTFKDKGMHTLARPLAALMAEAWSAHRLGQGQPLLIVPVPSARGGKVRRGYEPTWLLSTHLCRQVPATRAVRALRRTGMVASKPRKTMRRRARLINTPTYQSRVDLRGYSVVIVDDVVTTGASLESAARAILEAGAEVVGVIVVASATRQSPSPTKAENYGDTSLATGLRWRASQADS